MIKEDSYLKNLADICLTKSKELGSSDASVLVMNSVSENVNIRNRKIDGSERSDNLGITLTTYIGKKKASISSSNLKEENINTLVKRCIDATKVTPDDEFNSLPDKDLHFKGAKDLKLFDEADSSKSFKYFIFLSFSNLVSSYKLRLLICLANKSFSGKELNSSSGVIFVVSKHFSIKVFIFSSSKFDDEIDDLLLPK